MAVEAFNVSKKVLKSAKEEKELDFFLELSNSKGDSKIFVGKREVLEALTQKSSYAKNCKLSFLKEDDEEKETFKVIEELSTHVKDLSFLTLEYELERIQKGRVYPEKSVSLSEFSLRLSFNHEGLVPVSLTVKKGTPLMPVVVWLLTKAPRGLIMSKLMFKTALSQFTGLSDYEELFTLVKVKKIESLEDVKNLLLPLSKLTKVASEYVAVVLKNKKSEELHDLFAKAVNHFELSNKLSVLSEGENYKVVFSVKEGSVLLENKKTKILWKIEDQGIEKKGKEEDEEAEEFLKTYYDLVLKDLAKHLKERRRKLEGKVRL